MAARHQRLDLEAGRLGKLDATVVVGKLGALVDVDEDALVRRLEAAQQPAEARAEHRLGLLLREQLGFDEATQPEFGAEARLQIGQAVHQLDEAFADVQLVVIEHEAGEAVLGVQVLDLLQDRGGVAVADLAEALAVAAAAEAAAERTAELRDQARRAMAFDAVAVGFQVDQMARRQRRLR